MNSAWLDLEIRGQGEEFDAPLININSLPVESYQIKGFIPFIFQTIPLTDLTPIFNEL